jgi:hypothetical protein
VSLVGYVIASRNQALGCTLPADIRRRGNVQEVIKNEHREERKEQCHVVPDPAYVVSSWY